MTFAGLEFDGRTAQVRVGRRRTWRLRLALDHILAVGVISGKELEALVGHYTWSAVVRRESLSVFDHTYKFIRKHYFYRTRLDAGTRQELFWARSILPMLRADLSIPWSETATCTDASHEGFGVCERRMCIREIASVGRLSERKRFQTEDCIHARAHALSCEQKDTPFISPDDDRFDSHSEEAQLIADRFCEVNKELLCEKDWAVVQSYRWHFQDNILRTEGLAAVCASRRLVRSTRNRNHRHLFLVDNLPLVLSMCKGRAKSRYLNPICRQIFALSVVGALRVFARWNTL